MMYLDLDGRIYIGRPPSAIPVSTSSIHTPIGISTLVALPIKSLPHLFLIGSWEYKVARLLERVQATQELFYEDWEEIAEPLKTLIEHEELSDEQHTAVQAAKEDYQQAIHVIDQALTRILEHFPGEMLAMLRQVQEEDTSIVHSSSQPAISSLPSQKERCAEMATP